MSCGCLEIIDANKDYPFADFFHKHGFNSGQFVDFPRHNVHRYANAILRACEELGYEVNACHPWEVSCNGNWYRIHLDVQMPDGRTVDCWCGLPEEIRIRAKELA